MIVASGTSSRAWTQLATTGAKEAWQTIALMRLQI